MKASMPGMFCLTVLVSFFALYAGEQEKKPVTTFLDTLNNGREVSLTGADFSAPSVAQKPAVQGNAAQQAADTLSGAITAGPKHEAGVVPSRFKIQILAGTQEQQVKKEKNVLAAKISLPVSVSFEAPYYKLFAGDFAQRIEAETWCAQLKNLGYNDVWIVRTAAAQK
jgi:hypothetical protein